MKVFQWIVGTAFSASVFVTALMLSRVLMDSFLSIPVDTAWTLGLIGVVTSSASLVCLIAMVVAEVATEKPWKKAA